MDKKKLPLILILIMLVLVTLACGISKKEPSPSIQEEVPATQDVLQPNLEQPTADLPPLEQPTEPEPIAAEETPEIEPNAGQIAYIYQANIYRYLVDSGEIEQITTDGVIGDNQNAYGNAQFSPDGRYLAYNKGFHKQSFLLDLLNDTTTEISDSGIFFRWAGEGSQYFATVGGYECPAIENLEDQELINFDLLRVDYENLASSIFLSNIGRGLKYLAAISNDSEWVSVNFCGCYSECGGENLWHLPTQSAITPAVDLYPGSIDFSPDSQRLTVSQHQMFGYVESPVYVAEIDLTNMTEVFFEPNVAPIGMQWSPDGDWIAFTAISFADDAFTEIDKRVIIIKSDGSQQTVVEYGFAEFVDWSPDGSQLIFSQEISEDMKQLYIYDLTSADKTMLPFTFDRYSDFVTDWGALQY